MYNWILKIEVLLIIAMEFYDTYPNPSFLFLLLSIMFMNFNFHCIYLWFFVLSCYILLHFVTISENFAQILLINVFSISRFTIGKIVWTFFCSCFLVQINKKYIWVFSWWWLCCVDIWIFSFNRKCQIVFKIVFSIMVYYRILNIFPCARVEYCCLFYIEYFLSANISLPHCFFPLVSIRLFSMSVSLFPFIKYIHLYRILGSTCKWFHIFTFVWLHLVW